MRKIIGFIPLAILVLAVWFTPPVGKNTDHEALKQNMNQRLDKLVQDLIRLESATVERAGSGPKEERDDRTITEFWSSIYQSYDYLRLRDVSFRYAFLYRVVQLWATKTGDELHSELMRWHKREAERDMLEYEVSQKEWDKRIEKIRISIDRFKSDSNEKRIEVEVATYPVILQSIIADVKKISASLPAGQNSSTSTLIDMNDARQVFVLTLLSVLLGLGLHHFLNPGKKINKSLIIQESAVSAAPEIERQLEAIAPPKLPSGTVDVETVLAHVIQSNQHVLKAGNIKIEKMISDFGMPLIYMDESTLKDGLQNFFMGSIGLVDASHQKASISLTPLCRIVERRLNLSFKIQGASIDEQAIERNTLALADSASPILFANAEKTLRIYQPIISVSAKPNETYINLQMG